MKKIILGVILIAIFILAIGGIAAYKHFSDYKSDAKVEKHSINVSEKNVESESDFIKPVEYSFINNNGKYNFISYDDKIPLNKWYNEPRIAEGGEMGVYSDFSGVYYTNYGGKDFSDEEENNWLNRGAFPEVYYVFPYDTGTSKIYHPVNIGNPEHWGHECTYNCDYDSAVLIQESTVKTKENNWADIDYNGKYGAAYDNKVTVKPIYDYGIMNVYNDMTALKSGNKWGYFNGKTGEKVIDFIADEIAANYYCESLNERYSQSRPYTYSDEYVSIKSNEEWAMYDEKGNIVIDYGKFDEIRPVHNGKAWVKDKKTGLWGVISLPRTWQDIYKEKLAEYYSSDEFTNDQNPQLGSMFDLCDINNEPLLRLLHLESYQAVVEMKIKMKAWYVMSNQSFFQKIAAQRYLTTEVSIGGVIMKMVSLAMERQKIVILQLSLNFQLKDKSKNFIILNRDSYWRKSLFSLLKPIDSK